MIKEFSPLHLKAKFSGLSENIKPYILAKGRPFHKKIWNSEFYLLPYSIFWLFAFFIAFYICLNKMYSQPKFVKNLVQNAKDNLEKYDWQNIVQKVNLIYQNLIK